MGLFGFLKSDEEKLKSMIRDGFDDSVKKAASENGDLIKDPFVGGMLVQAAIAAQYESLKGDKSIKALAAKLGIDIDSLLEQECHRAMSKYLKY